jgi:hypothetical protein
MKRAVRKWIKVIIVNLLLLACLLEFASIALYYHHTGRFFYSRHKSENAVFTLPSNAEGFDEAGSANVKRTLHPYLGFVYDERFKSKLQFSTVEYGANNIGLLSPYDYPYRKKSDNQFIIGIFGGSVAMYYGFYELENHVLVDSLKQLPYFQNKQIVVLPFASGSYKQPQQLLELNYFTALGQDFDLVINIDGFNETALSYINNQAGFDSAMPSVEMFRPLAQLADGSLSSNQIALIIEILKIKDDLRTSQARLNSCRLAACYGLSWIQLRYYLRQYQKKSEEFNTLATRSRRAPSLDDAVLDDMASVWAKSELAMSQLLTARRIPYFQFLQPNQYYSTGRKFSEAEQQIALDPASRYSPGVIKGYPRLIGRIEDLKKAGVNVINGANVFDETAESVYVDSCCHYNHAGNEVFARFVAGQIVKSFQAQPIVR